MQIYWTILVFYMWKGIKLRNMPQLSDRKKGEISTGVVPWAPVRRHWLEIARFS